MVACCLWVRVVVGLQEMWVDRDTYQMLRQKQQEKDEVQIHKFWQMFKQLHINITLADALILMPKYQKMLKTLLSNKEKLQELANTPFNENCSAVILKKLPEKLEDPGKFLIQPFLWTARALIDVHGEEMILRDGDERLALNMRHDSSSYSNQPQKESINLINVFNGSSEDFLQGGNVLPEKFPDLDSTKYLHPPLHVNPLSGSTTYSSSPKSSLEEPVDELALITFPSKYDDDLQFDVESDLKEIEFLLHKDIDSSLKDSIDQSNFANPADNFVDSMLEMFTDAHAFDYSSPSIFDEYDDDFLEVESDTENVYDDPFDSKGEKIKESKLFIDELDLPCDFLPFEYDSFISQNFSRVDALPSTNNEDKVFNPGILIQEKPFEIITRVVQDKKLAISNASSILEDFDPPFYEPLFFKEVSSLVGITARESFGAAPDSARDLTTITTTKIHPKPPVDRFDHLPDSLLLIIFHVIGILDEMTLRDMLIRSLVAAILNKYGSLWKSDLEYGQKDYLRCSCIYNLAREKEKALGSGFSYNCCNCKIDIWNLLFKINVSELLNSVLLFSFGKIGLRKIRGCLDSGLSPISSLEKLVSELIHGMLKFSGLQYRQVHTKHILADDPSQDNQLSHPGGQWLPGAYVNPARDCLGLGNKRNLNDVDVIWRDEGNDQLPVKRMTVRKLRLEIWLVAYALDTLGLDKGYAIVIDMPMDVNSVVIYLAIVLEGVVAGECG
nr:probable acyl-activating enzyme 17, peroxisomal [Tanacetum cinerariifolium]